ncbi:MarR family winged helix-turn-helix transcriptional regulator [Antrihabitans spumae]|uniref:MarR family winged helix-turn-helix transcriptional regulator n=1 Tax=Antrihabitans spumae TaxID=3373370 RepID=A0ABW7K8Y4_9NOCA
MYMNRSESGEAAGDLFDDWVQLASFVASVDTSLGKWLTDHHRLVLTEYRALRQLDSMPDKELRINDLAHRIGLNQSSVTRLLVRLETRGLTRRDTCSEDGRGVHAVITAEGEALVAQAREPFRIHLDRTLQRLHELYPALVALPIGRALADLDSPDDT